MLVNITEIGISETFLNSNKKHFLNINLFCIGFLIYSVSFPHTAITGLYFKISQLFQISGLILILVSSFSLIKLRFDDQYLKIIFLLYCSWHFFVILSSFDAFLDFDFLKYFLFDPRNGGMFFFAPFILLFPRNIIFYKRLFDLIFIFGIFYILFDSIFIGDLLNVDRSSIQSQGTVEILSDLSFASGFLLLSYTYHSQKRQLFAIMIIILSIFFAIYRARRGLILMYGSMAIFSYLFYISHSRLKLIIIYSTFLIVLIALLYFSNIYNIGENKIFGFLSDRGTEDTRSIVELYFYDDMKTNDWLFGRGINGQYFCPGVDENQISNYRTVIETGFLQTILKSGILSIVLFILMAIPAIIRGLFDSKNILSKAAAIWIFLSLINSYPAVVNSFTLQYLLVWVSIGICFSKNIRYIPETKLKEIFKQKNSNPLSA